MNKQVATKIKALMIAYYATNFSNPVQPNLY